jgi:hypothetical protein
VSQWSDGPRRRCWRTCSGTGRQRPLTRQATRPIWWPFTPRWLAPHRPGFLRSATFQVAGAPWLPQQRDCYEDWYLIRDWAAVGTLNTNAVAPAHTKAHDRVARQAECGTGGLYALRAGDGVPGGTAATWFAKPAGWSYADLESALQSCLDRGLTLWQRLMVLSPAPEFCLRGEAAPGLAAPLHGPRVPCRALR